MEVLRSYSQLVNKTSEVFGIDISQVPMLDKMNDSDLEQLAEKVLLCEDVKKVGELSELVFQLNDFLNALVNYTKIMLLSNKYEAVKEFISKLYVSHVGGQNYQSKKQTYSYDERLFDRFIEVVKSANIEIAVYLPLVMEAITNESSLLYAWKNPAMEYMQNLMRESEDKVNDFMETHKEYQLDYIKLILEFNTQKGIAILFNNTAIAGALEQNADAFLKQYIKDTINYFDKHLPETGEMRFHYIKIMSSIINNVEIEGRLEKIYEAEKDSEIKEFLAQRLGISEEVNFGTERHFEVLAMKKVAQPQQRALGVAFDNLPLHFVNGQEVNDVVKTYLIQIFKEEPNLLNLGGFADLKTIFDKDELAKFAWGIWAKHMQRDDILSAKWCVRMVSILSEGMMELELIEFNVALYKMNRNKEAKYLTSCLIASKKEGVLEMFKRLGGNEFFEKNKDQFLQEYSQNAKMDLEEIKDLSLSETLSEQEKQDEIKRLYNSFLSGRKYSWDMFKKLFVYKPCLNEFANHLVFGEYKLGTLHSIFTLKGKDIEYIYGNKLVSEDSEPYVMLVHPLDLDERFEKVEIKIEQPLFNQFFKSNFNVKEFNRSNLWVANMQGMLVNGEKFVSALKQKDFVINVKDGENVFSSMIHLMPTLNMFAELEFEKAITKNATSATVGQIRFYRLSNCMKDGEKYITNKSNSLSVGAIPERYFDYVLGSVQSAIKA